MSVKLREIPPAVLAALARRGVGRVTWLSQGTLDRLRTAGAMPVHPVTPERTVH